MLKIKPFVSHLCTALGLCHTHTLLCTAKEGRKTTTHPMKWCTFLQIRPLKTTNRELSISWSAAPRTCRESHFSSPAESAHLQCRRWAPQPPGRGRAWKPHKGTRRSPACRASERRGSTATGSQMGRACEIIFGLTSLHALIAVITSLMALLNESQRLPPLARCLPWPCSSRARLQRSEVFFWGFFVFCFLFFFSAVFLQKD